MVRVLPREELVCRARRLRLVLSDVDGVLTDAGVYYTPHGEELRRFSVRDGMGVELLRNAGVETGFVTREHATCVAERARKLGLRYVYTGIRDKLAELPRILRDAGLALDEVGYIGDDVNDVPILRAVGEAGLTACPADATDAAAAITHLQTLRPGGHGAFRDFAESILKLREEEVEP